MTEEYVIIGDGIAGATAAETLRKGDEEAAITVLTDEDEPLYNRIMLKTYMKGNLPKQYTRVHDQKWYEDRDIELRLREKAVEVDREENLVKTGDREYSYDRLLVATGGSPRKLPQDDGFENIFYMWTMKDAEKIREDAEQVDKAVVVGGGLLGIDLATVYAEHGADVDYLIRGSQWWHRGLDEDGAEIVHRKLEEEGVNIQTDTEVEEVKSENGEVNTVVSKDGREFECDSVAAAIGQTPNFRFIDVEKNIEGMIKTDEFLQTSDRDVYAAGNMVELFHPVYEKSIVKGSWDNSEEMGRTAAKNMQADSSEEKEIYNYINTYGVGHFDVQFLAIGDWSGETVSRKYSDEEYRRLFFQDDRLVGAVLIGEISDQEDLKQLIQGRERVYDKEKLLN